MKKLLFVLTATFLYSVFLIAQPSIQWQKCLGGTGADEAYSIQQTTEGGYIIAGHSFSTNGDVTGNHGPSDYWIVKLNTTGTIDWQKCLGGSLNDNPNSVQETTDHGYIVAGTPLQMMVM